MNRDFFKHQMGRMITRFGQKAFDHEFINLVWREVEGISEASFIRFVDVMIGSRSHNKPPLLSEFREARIKDEKWRFDNEVKAAAQVIYGPNGPPAVRRQHVLDVLSKEFGKVHSINEALEIAKHRLRMARAERGPDGAR